MYAYNLGSLISVMLIFLKIFIEHFLIFKHHLLIIDLTFNLLIYDLFLFFLQQSFLLQQHKFQQNFIQMTVKLA